MRIQGISKTFGDLVVFDDFTLAFPESGLVGIGGPSGAGKSTLLRIIAGLEQPDSGSIEDVPERVAMQFEDDRLFPWMNVLENVMLVGCDEPRALQLLDDLGLAGKRGAHISALSGGQRRRVALARALAFPAPLAILDEPTARLDAESSKLVMDVIRSECANSLAIMASHDQNALDRCDAVITIEH